MNIMHSIRNRFGISQAEFAEIAGVSQGTVSRWEKSLFEPNRNELERIRDVAISRGIEWDDGLFFSPRPSESLAPAAQIVAGMKTEAVE